MSTYVADAAACMADLHEQGWRMSNAISRVKNYFGVSPDGKLKLLKRIEPDAANSKPNNIKALAHTLIGCMGTMGPDSEAYLRQQTVAFSSERKDQIFLYQPDSDDAAFEFKVSSILTPVDSDGSEEDAMNVFDTDPSQRQRVYASLGLSAYGDWIERALYSTDANNPATARELSELISRNEQGVGSDEARRGLYSAVKKIVHNQFKSRPD